MQDLTPAIVLLTADLRVHDHPALHAALNHSPAVVGVFVRDQSLPWARPAKRYSAITDAVADVATNLHKQAIPLIVRTGDPVVETVRIAHALNAEAIYLAADVTPRARRRVARLRAELTRPAASIGPAAHRRARLVVVDGVMDIVPPGTIAPIKLDHYRQFSAYYRAWQRAARRAVLPAGRAGVSVQQLDEHLAAAGLQRAVASRRRPGVPPIAASERDARRRMNVWLAEYGASYADLRDDLAVTATSQLSTALHLGALSANELAAASADHDAFVRQLAWRDFNRQIVAADPEVLTTGLYPNRRRWIDDDEGFVAWTAGLTGFPVVDAAMRQLAQTGWMHNRARMIVASFLTKHLGIHWSRGADWFLRHLVDGDVVNNTLQWQWVAGVGADARPGRMFNPVIQSEKFDPHGRFIRRWVDELREVGDVTIHDPWSRAPLSAASTGYPPPIVEHQQARMRFLTELRYR